MREESPIYKFSSHQGRNQGQWALRPQRFLTFNFAWFGQIVPFQIDYDEIEL